MDSQKFCLKWDGFQGSVTSVFDQLRAGGELLDVTLCSEGQRVRAHRMMLSACSPYFRDVLKNTPCQQMVIFLKDTSAADLTAIVEFMYKGNVNVAQSQLASFIKTAEMLQIRGLSGDEEKPPDPVPAASPLPPRQPPPPARVFSPPLKRRRVSDCGDAPLSSGPAPVPSPAWPRPAASPARRPAASPARRPETPILLSGSSNQSAPSTPPPPTVAASPAAASRGVDASAATASAASVALVGTVVERAASEDAPPRPPPARSVASAEAETDGIKVEKVDISDGDDGGESSLDAALGQLAEYEGGGYGGVAGPSPAAAAAHAVSFPGHHYGLMPPLPGPSQQGVASALMEDGSSQGGYRCDICGIVYQSAGSLRNHQPRHRGRTACALCGHVFSIVSSLRKHLRNVHHCSPEQLAEMVPPALPRNRTEGGMTYAGARSDGGAVTYGAARIDSGEATYDVARSNVGALAFGAARSDGGEVAFGRPRLEADVCTEQPGH